MGELLSLEVLIMIILMNFIEIQIRIIMIIKIEKKIRIRLLLWLYFPNLTSLTTIPFFITKIILPSTSSNFPFYIIILISYCSLFIIPSNIPRFILSYTFFYIIFIISILIPSFSLISIISFSLPNLAFLIVISSLICTSFYLPIKRLTCTSCTRANLSFFNSSIIRRTTSCYWH